MIEEQHRQEIVWYQEKEEQQQIARLKFFN